MPSEIRDLKWVDVNWEKNTVLLKSPKTICKGKPERMVPIFAELRDYLSRQFDAVEEGEVYVFPRLRSHTNTATTAAKYVTAAGFVVWPKFWNSLRASCETDLMDDFGLRKACQWIGNSPAIAMKHYALMKKTDYVDVGSKSGAKSGAVRVGNSPQELERDSEIPGKSAIFERETTRHGLEP